jgi:hypothetical protein
MAVLESLNMDVVWLFRNTVPDVAHIDLVLLRTLLHLSIRYYHPITAALYENPDSEDLSI